MKKYAAGILLSALLGAGGYYGLVVVPSSKLRASLDQVIAKLPSGYKISYAHARYSLITRTATIEGLSGQTQGDDATKFQVAILSIKGPNLDLIDDWNHASASTTALKPDQTIKVADRIAMEGLAVDSPLASGTVSKFSVDGAQLYPWALLHAGMPPISEVTPLFRDFSTSQAKASQEIKHRQDSGDPMTPQELQQFQLQQLQDMLPILRVEAGVVLGNSLTAADAENLSFRMKQPAVGDAPAFDITVTAKAMHEEPFDRGIGGGATMDDLTEKFGPNGDIEVGRATVGRMSYRDTMKRLLDGDPLSMSLFDGATLEGMKFEKFTVQLPTGQRVSIDNAAVSNVAFDNGSWSSGAFQLSGFKISKTDLPPTPQAQAMFAQLGLDTVTIGFGASYAKQPDGKTAKLKDVLLKIDELGSLTLSADLAGIGQGDGAGGDAATFTGGSLRYDDASLLDRLLSARGKRSPAQIQQARQAIAKQVEFMLAGASEQKGISESIKAISDFATNPHSLTITATPPSPVPVASLKTLSAGGLTSMIATLGLTASANQ
jgi:hypothetical protein